MPSIPEIPVVVIQEDTQIPNRTYRLDLDSGRIVGYVDGEDAVSQAAMKSMRTPRYACYAYDDQYGSEITALIGNKAATREYLETEMEFILTDALCSDGRFSGIDELKMAFESDSARFSFYALTTLGKIQMEGATNNV